MSRQPLFLNQNLSLEKRASDTPLDVDPDEWPTALLKHAHRELPWLRYYEADVEIDRTEPARGYAVGRMLVYPTRMRKEAALREKRIISLPLIIKEGSVAPFDVYSHEGKMFPMDNDVVQEVLFTERLFEGAAPKGKFKGTSLVGQLSPPSRGGGGFHKSASLADAALASARKEDVDALRSRIEKSATLRAAVARSEFVQPFVDKALSVEKTAGAKWDFFVPADTLQVRASGPGYLVKRANRAAFAPYEEYVSRHMARDLLSEELLNQLDERGYATVSSGEGGPVKSTAPVADFVKKAGVYETTIGGSRVRGIVIPHTLSFDGEDLGHMAYLGESSYSMQEKVAGVQEVAFTGNVLDDLNYVSPHGDGIMVYGDGNILACTEPFHVDSRVTIEKQAYLHVTRSRTGEKARLMFVDGLEKFASLGDGLYALPAEGRFLPLAPLTRQVADNPWDVDMVLGATSKEKVAGATTLVGGHDSFYFRGADETFPEIMNRHEASFALASKGVRQDYLEDALNKANRDGEVLLSGLVNPVPREEAAADVIAKTASEFRRYNIERVDLLKEACMLSMSKEASSTIDKESVDTILSLGFMTPESVSVYVNFIPDLEKTATQLAEIVVASRLGMDDVRETAAVNAMNQVTSVLRGLRSLREKIN